MAACWLPLELICSCLWQLCLGKVVQSATHLWDWGKWQVVKNGSMNKVVLFLSWILHVVCESLWVFFSITHFINFLWSHQVVRTGSNEIQNERSKHPELAFSSAMSPNAATCKLKDVGWVCGERQSNRTGKEKFAKLLQTQLNCPHLYVPICMSPLYMPICMCCEMELPLAWLCTSEPWVICWSTPEW